ncbi:MAG: CNNM domain-containing protein [Planctomycetota bacterium]|nr:CNNM domain-containing protein [Planctomycetota bacterium]
MEILLMVLALLLCLAGSFLYAGAETGFYTLSREQVEGDAEAGSRTAGWVRRLLRDESALLITLLIGNNLVLELATHVGDDLVSRAGLGPVWTATLVTLLLTPVVFLFGEALPKDLFHGRPQSLSYAASGFVLLSRYVYWPLERVLRCLSALLERAFGLHQGDAAPRARERLTNLLVEGERQGVLPLRARVLAENALALRQTRISTCMTPWSNLLTLPEGGDDAELRATLASSKWTRLPVVAADGSFQGYVHQLEVLSAGADEPVLVHCRPLPVFPAEMPVDRALLRLRASGKRAAVVGSAEQPEGLVTLKDLVEEISGDLSGI